MADHTPTPWAWVIHDHSMASLGVLPDPGLGDPLVLAISPCDSCAKQAEPKEWKWGRCHTPSETDAQFILTACNNHDALMLALENARRDLLSLKSRSDTGSARDRRIEAAAARIAEALTLTSQDGGNHD